VVEACGHTLELRVEPLVHDQNPDARLVDDSREHVAPEPRVQPEERQAPVTTSAVERE
jgi:hypothetical protein